MKNKSLLSLCLHLITLIVNTSCLILCVFYLNDILHVDPKVLAKFCWLGFILNSAEGVLW